MGVPHATLVGAEYASVTVVLGVVAIIARVIALPVVDAEGGKVLELLLTRSNQIPAELIMFESID